MVSAVPMRWPEDQCGGVCHFVVRVLYHGRTTALQLEKKTKERTSGARGFTNDISGVEYVPDFLCQKHGSCNRGWLGANSAQQRAGAS